jgi:hypothetical protein
MSVTATDLWRSCATELAEAIRVPVPKEETT